MTTRIRIFAATVAVLAVAAEPAFAAHTLDLNAPSDVVVGKPASVTASGTTPLNAIQFPYWFSLDAIPTSFTRTCPPDAFSGSQIALNSGGAIIVLTQPETPDANGSFSIPVAINPTAAGSVLLCGYTDDGAAATLASASAIVNIHKRAQPRRKARCRHIHSRKRRAACLRAARPR
jgi:hypothetical protein